MSKTNHCLHVARYYGTMWWDLMAKNYTKEAENARIKVIVYRLLATP